jgi:hypothetical protein
MKLQGSILFVATCLVSSGTVLPTAPSTLVEIAATAPTFDAAVEGIKHFETPYTGKELFDFYQHL